METRDKDGCLYVFAGSRTPFSHLSDTCNHPLAAWLSMADNEARMVLQLQYNGEERRYASNTREMGMCEEQGKISRPQLTVETTPSLSCPSSGQHGQTALSLPFCLSLSTHDPPALVTSSSIFYTAPQLYFATFMIPTAKSPGCPAATHCIQQAR